MLPTAIPIFANFLDTFKAKKEAVLVIRNPGEPARRSNRWSAACPVGVMGCKTPSEYMSSELLQIADIVRSVFHYSASPLVLRITAFGVRANPR
jgi:hypothetical protein